MSDTGADIELVKLLKNGDLPAFESIYNRYCHKVHKFVFKFLKQEEDTEEIVQEVFIKIWECREKIDLDASFDSFLFTIAYNATMSLLRKRINVQKSREYLRSLQHHNQRNHIIDEIQFMELNQKIQSILAQLTIRQKEIYHLSREDGLTHDAIAKKLNISESTVNNHLVVVMKYLKTHLVGGLIIIVLCFFLLFL